MEDDMNKNLLRKKYLILFIIAVSCITLSLFIIYEIFYTTNDDVVNNNENINEKYSDNVEKVIDIDLDKTLNKEYIIVPEKMIIKNIELNNLDGKWQLNFIIDKKINVDEFNLNDYYLSFYDKNNHILQVNHGSFISPLEFGENNFVLKFDFDASSLRHLKIIKVASM